MLFKKTEDAQKLISLVKTEEKTLAALEKKIGSIKAEWAKRSEKAENLVAQKTALVGSYRQPQKDDKGRYLVGQGTNDAFFDERGVQLDEQIEKAIAERDQLTSGVMPEILAVKDRISRRRDIIVGAFTAWADQVASTKKYTQILGRAPQYELADDVREQLLADRQTMMNDQTSDIEGLLKRIVDWIERIEGLDNIQCPLFRMDGTIAAALAVA
jgi:hypothetical protein